MAEVKCITTKKSIANDVGSVRFPCPVCGELIVRSKNARQNGAKYTCVCGFEGP
jgi:predicted RNA-binding Zn-ribbon protein involved in translation (DUF1610 family)